MKTSVDIIRNDDCCEDTYIPEVGDFFTRDTHCDAVFLRFCSYESNAYHFVNVKTGNMVYKLSLNEFSKHKMKKYNKVCITVSR